MELARFEQAETEVTKFGTFTAKYTRVFEQWNCGIKETFYRNSVEVGGGLWSQEQGESRIREAETRLQK